MTATVRTAAWTLYATVMILIGVIAGQIITGASHSIAGHGTAAVSCVPFTITDATPQEQIDKLLAQGWKGHADDSSEALYPPACAA